MTNSNVELLNAKQELRRLKQEQLRRLAEKSRTPDLSLYEFLQQAWRIIEPTTPFVPGWHIEAVCEHLEAVSAGEVRNLIITVPPRSSKSSVVSVAFVAWQWTFRPHTRFLTASYALNLAVRDATRSRRVIMAPWYKRHWGNRFRLTGDNNLKSRYENDRTGYRISLSVDSGTTGEGGHITIIDDPHNVVEAESEATIAATIRWHDEAFFNRVNDAKTGCRIVIGQRVGVRDLIGHLLDQGGFEELRIPEEFDAKRRCTTSIGWKDPRKDEGELLRPERFGPAQVTEAKKRLGSVAYAAQHQQVPVPREGALFKENWFRYFTHVSDGFQVNGKFVSFDDCWWFATVDPAGGESTSADYTAIGIFAVTPKRDLLVVHIDRSRTAAEKVVPHIKDTLDGWPVSYVTVEDCFLQKKLFVEPAKRTAGMPPVRAVNPGGKDKYARALPAVVLMEAGQIYLLEKANWLDEFKLELLQFTGKNDAHDDQVDCLSFACAEWAKAEMEDAEPFLIAMPQWYESRRLGF